MSEHVGHIGLDELVELVRSWPEEEDAALFGVDTRRLDRLQGLLAEAAREVAALKAAPRQREWLTLTETADVLGVSTDQLARWRLGGGGPRWVRGRNGMRGRPRYLYDRLSVELHNLL